MVLKVSTPLVGLDAPDEAHYKENKIKSNKKQPVILSASEK